MSLAVFRLLLSQLARCEDSAWCARSTDPARSAGSPTAFIVTVVSHKVPSACHATAIVFGNAGESRPLPLPTGLLNVVAADAPTADFYPGDIVRGLPNVGDITSVTLTVASTATDDPAADVGVWDVRSVTVEDCVARRVYVSRATALGGPLPHSVQVPLSVLPPPSALLEREAETRRLWGLARLSLYMPLPL